MYEELVKALRHCNTYGCKGCPYEGIDGCITVVRGEAANTIESLIQENSFLKLMQQELTKDIPENELGIKAYNALKAIKIVNI